MCFLSVPLGEGQERVEGTACGRTYSVFLFYSFKEKLLAEKRDGVLSGGCFLSADD